MQNNTGKRNPESLKWLNGIGQKKKKKKERLYKTRQARIKNGQKLTVPMEKKMRMRHAVELDRVFSIFIRNKRKRCVSCWGKNDHCWHFIRRGYRPFRRYEKNCHSQCYQCNVGKNGNYIQYTKWMIHEYGQEFVFHLIDTSNVLWSNKKQSLLFLQEKIAYYKEIVGAELIENKKT